MAVGYLRSVQQIREVVDRCPQRRKSSAHYGDGTAGCAPRPLVQAFHIPRRSRFYGGSGVYRPPRREMAGIPGVSRLTFLTLSRFARVLHPLLPRFSILRMHAGSCGCIWRRAGTYWRLRAVAAFTVEPTAETAMPASSARVAKTLGRRSWSRRVGPSTTRWSPMKTRASLWP